MSGCQMGIEHFGRQFMRNRRLHGLGLDYLKVDASFIRGLEENRQPGFPQGLSLPNYTGRKVIAEGVASEARIRERAVSMSDRAGDRFRDRGSLQHLDISRLVDP